MRFRRFNCRFVGLGFNAVLAGVVSPWASHDAMRLAVVAASFCALAWVLWRFYRREVKREPAASVEGAALEPAERL